MVTNFGFLMPVTTLLLTYLPCCVGGWFSNDAMANWLTQNLLQPPDPEFFQRSWTVLPNDTSHYGDMLINARQRGKLTLLIVGGSTSTGGGAKSTAHSYPHRLIAYFKAQQIEVTLGQWLRYDAEDYS